MRRSHKIRSADMLLVVLVVTIFPLLWLLSVLKPVTTRAGMPLPGANKFLAQQVFEELLNDGHLAIADKLFAPDFRQHAPNLPTAPLGAEGMKLLAMLYRTAFFDLRYTIEDIVAEGDKVAIRWTASGLYLRAFDLYAPSGKQVRWAGMTVYRVENNRIVEGWLYQIEPNLAK